MPLWLCFCTRWISTGRANSNTPDKYHGLIQESPTILSWSGVRGLTNSETACYPGAGKYQ